ncbi:hypothetical protein R3X25_11255 [Lutibacter sp. TH_r2]|uniref:hypothetical protein n=1 Tax=Lutibacter sp. TH_r2 TaxID=3082083 RepID=UPI002954C084|nr:hypothetical protein [Lutibacter sp. TH_r2]MDV7187859.1 hypothetical protein [Lutibacter sp. TH_r2]
MKSLFKKVVLIAVMVTGLVSMANERDVNIKIKGLDSKLIQFTLNNFDGDMQISMKDSEGHVFYTEDFNGIVYTKTYDLKTLPKGVYFIELNGETKIKTFPIHVKENKLEFDYDKTEVYYKPVVVVNESLVKITKLSLNLDPLKVEMYNSENDLIYTETLKGRMDLKRSLNLEELPEGHYNLVLTTKEEVLVKEIEI